jgi:hypothetical protein
MAKKNEDRGGAEEVSSSGGTSLGFDVPEEIKSSWIFLFLTLSSPLESAGGGN